VIWAQALDANQRSIRILEGLGLVEIDRGAEGIFLGRRTYFRRFRISATDWTISTH
jgi:hypothetical protein